MFYIILIPILKILIPLP